MSNIPKGCATLILATGIVIVLAFAGMTSIARSLADWRVSANGATVALQETAQTRIEWDARTEIARIDADATKKTSFAFVGFYLARAITWAAGLVWVAVAVLFFVRWAVLRGN